mgnify:CR=1 FL=1
MTPSQGGGKQFLARARQLRSEIDEDVATPLESPTTELQPEQVVRHLLKALDELESSLESPGRLFELLVEQLKLTKAVLLLPDHQSDRFLVWSSIGIDRTTQQRLRPRESELQAIFADRGEDVLVLTETELDALAPYLSHRERDAMERAGIFPFRHGRQTLAVLIILDSPYLDLDPSILRILLAAMADTAGKILFSNRDIPIARARRSVLFNRDEIARTIESMAGTVAGAAVATVFRLDVGPARNQILATNPLLDEYRTTQDIVTVMAAFLAGEGFAGLESSDTVVVVLPGETQTDRDLLIHQLRHSLVSLFRELTEPPELPFQEVDDLSSFAKELRS